MGWRRTGHYYYHRVFRGNPPVHKITNGLAVGAAVSWSPFIGTHILHVILFAWLFRVNLIAGITGTLWGNPWTFPFMYWIAYHVGVWVCGLFGLSDFVAFEDFIDMEFFIAQPWRFVLYMLSNPLKILLPLTLGGYICALLFWPLAFGVLYYPVYILRGLYRQQRLSRLNKKRQKRRVGKQL